VRVVVTGRTGQLATSLIERGKTRPGVEVVAIGRPALELSAPATIAPALAAARPDVVVSAAAYTAVDAAEDDREAALAINAGGAEAVAAAAAALEVPVIHVSTDYVFDGTKIAPYVETDATGPLNVYGMSKLAGEQAVATANPRHAILRASWVYSPFGSNFVRTMLMLAQRREQVAVVSDQWGSPSAALDLADAILVVAEALAGGAAGFGVYHLAGSGETNWSGFAREIFEASRRHGGPFAAVRDIASADYPQRARRPANSRLDCTKFAEAFGWRMPDWRESTDAVVRRLVKE
jgi:dTDP-4-dehydrorhamnose reductase